MTQSTKNIVLVHGGFVDGSGWESVYNLLKKDDYNVAIVQNPTLSLAGDVAATKLIINQQDGPVILVGHSYGGAVISNAVTDTANVVGLVFVATARIMSTSIRRGRELLVAGAIFVLVGPLHVHTVTAVLLVAPVSLWMYRPRRGADS